MTVRPLALLDLPLIYRYKDEALAMDGTRTLTQGNPLGALGFLTYLNPVRHIYTSIADGDGPTVLGGITHSQGKSFAKLLYLAPQYRLGDIDLTLLLEDLAKAAGSWGALHVIAEIDETNLVFNALRKSGFSVYAWQRMWDVSHLKPFVHNTGTWRRIRSVQQPAIQSLYYQIVPPLLHPVEPLTNPSKGVIYEGELNCFAGITSGAYGMVLTPLIHPEVNAVEEKLSSLLSSLPQRRGRSVYMCVRSYQAWLEPVLADLGAVATQRQAVMVKHLARFVKDEQSLATVPKGVSVQPSQMGRVETKD